MRHELKIHPEPFWAVVHGLKMFEFRKNDRGYGLGDTLYLREYIPERSEYTGRWIEVNVTWILSEGYGLPDGFVIMSISRRVP